MSRSNIARQSASVGASTWLYIASAWSLFIATVLLIPTVITVFVQTPQLSQHGIVALSVLGAVGWIVLSMAIYRAMVAKEIAERNRGVDGHIVCLCGSTKFKQAFERAVMDESLKGNIVLSVACFTHHDALIISDEQKRIFDALHLKKIELATEILVLNVGGYIGESTRREIAYAESLGRGVRYLESA